jgi:BTB/POZ domain
MTMDRLPESLLRPAARASAHGVEIVTVNAGTKQRTQIFKIHKDLLCRSSSFFNSTFNGHFLESETGCLELAAVDPMTFEVLYQWLYTGSVRDIADFAADSGIDIDLLWLRVFTAAHQYMIKELQEISFYHFRKAFHDFHRVVPSVACVQELYESDLPTNLVKMLKSYLVLHCAYWIVDESCDCWGWQTVLEHANFGADIAWELTKRSCKDYVGVQSHPRYNVKFANHNGHVFIKKDNDEEGLREPHSSDEDASKSQHDSCNSENMGDSDGTEVASDA